MLNPDCLKEMEFIEKYLADYEKMAQIGYKKPQILKMLGTLQYVRDFADTPEWLDSATNLPKGYKWSEGTKYHQKGGKKSDSKTYIFLVIGEDLYIKDMLNHAYEFHKSDEVNEYGVPKTFYEMRDKRICIIRKWKKKRSHHVVYELNDIMTPFLENCINDFWHHNGGNVSYIKQKLMEVQT